MQTKALEQDQFAWPSASSAGNIAPSPPQLAALLDGCEWRAPSLPADLIAQIDTPRVQHTILLRQRARHH